MSENSKRKQKKSKKSASRTPSAKHRNVNRALQPGGDAAVQPGKGKGAANKYEKNSRTSGQHNQLDTKQERLATSVREAAFNDNDGILVELLSDAENVLSIINSQEKWPNAGWTALHYACANGRFTAPVLLNLGANPNITNDQGATPLMLACLYGRLKNARELLQRDDVDVSVQDLVHRTALHYAAANGYAEIVAMLIVAYRKKLGKEKMKRSSGGSAGGSSDGLWVTDKHGLTAMDLARVEKSSRWKDCITMLRNPKLSSQYLEEVQNRRMKRIADQESNNQNEQLAITLLVVSVVMGVVAVLAASYVK